MRNSKAFELISGLSAKQVKQLDEAVKLHKRVGVQQLFKLLAKAKGKGEPNSEEVYRVIFNKKHTKANDYLLRNEYRLLYDWLLEQVVGFLPKKDSANTINVLTFFLQHQHYELFEEEWKAAWKNAVQADNTTLLLQLSDLNIQYFNVGKPQSLANAEETKQLSQQRIEILKLDFLRKLRKEEIRANMSQRIISAYKPTELSVLQLNTLKLDELEANDLYAKYLSLRSKINFSKGQEKIDYLKQVVADQAIINKYEPHPEEALCRFWVNLAQEYYLLMDFNNAIHYFEKVKPALRSLPTALQESTLLNYILALMRNKNYLQAKQLAAERADLLLNSRLLGARAPFLIAVLHLYAREPDNAGKFVNFEIKKDGSEFYFLIRLVLSATYYLRGDLELALRETVNLDQAVNYEMNRDQTTQTIITKPIIAIFRRFYTTLLHTTGRKNASVFDELVKDINTALQSQNNQQPNSILTQWILYEIQHQFAGK